MKGYINIIGDIGTTKDAISLANVVAQVQGQKEATEFEVLVNSGGGSFYEGFKIYNYLKSLGKPITTVGSEMVASIATIIFASGDTRVMRPNSQFMIHLPSGEVKGVAHDIEAYAKELKSCQTQLADFYKANLGLTDEAIYPLLENETWLSPNEALQFGFATSVGQEITAKINFNKNENMNKLSNEDKGFIESIFNKFLGKRKEIVNVTKTTATGEILDFPDVKDGNPIEVGAMASIDGMAPQGEILMEDGEIYVFEQGKLEEKREAPKNSEDEEIHKNEKIEELERAIEERDKRIAFLEGELDKTKNEVTNLANEKEEIVKEVVNMKKEITSRFEPSKQEITNKTDNNKPQGRKLFKD